jgi:GNAT superfamily N-acetyltransferase
MGQGQYDLASVAVNRKVHVLSIAEGCHRDFGKDGTIAVEIVPFVPAHLPALAEWVAGRVRTLRALVPALPDTLTTPEAAGRALATLVDDGHLLVAVRGDTVLGHLGWYEFPSIRRASRRAAWIPEIGLGTDDPTTLERLFLAAAEMWEGTARQVVTATVLEGDQPLVDWFTANGFGRFLHDTVRPCTPIDHARPIGVTVRAATIDDALHLALLDTEHCAHYGRPPVFMVPPAPTPAPGWVTAIEHMPHAVWVAVYDGRPMGFVIFQPTSEGLAIQQAPDSVTVTGIYVRPALRGHGVAAALLSAGMAALATDGIRRVAIDHETTNPPARHFWPRHTTTIAASFMRVLERV